MKTVAIISEYNPFHNGHLYQIEKIREILGEDTAIIAIMSGSFTQRGEPAIMDKWARAKAATDAGVNLVLELPFPYSAASAELFARAGVAIADKLGVVDYLAFGSELGDTDALIEAADNMRKAKFHQALKSVIEDGEHTSLGYPMQVSLAYERAYGKKPPASEANNILAIEYIKALRDLKSEIIPITIKRSGAAYNDKDFTKNPFQSATAIRKGLTSDNISALDFVPFSTKSAYLEESSKHRAPTDPERLFSAIISNLRLNSPSTDKTIHDADGGLYNRLLAAANEATSIQSLIDLTATKKYTTARIRRVIWYSLFGVTSSDVKSTPEYTQVLAMDKIGQTLLKKIKKNGKITPITKPSSTPEFDIAKRQKELCDKADAIFGLTMTANRPISEIYRVSPYVKV